MPYLDLVNHLPDGQDNLEYAFEPETVKARLMLRRYLTDREVDKDLRSKSYDGWNENKDMAEDGFDDDLYNYLEPEDSLYKSIDGSS